MELAEGNFVLNNLAAAHEFSRCFNHSRILKLFIVTVKTSSHNFWTGPGGQGHEPYLRPLAHGDRRLIEFISPTLNQVKFVRCVVQFNPTLN